MMTNVKKKREDWEPRTMLPHPDLKDVLSAFTADAEEVYLNLYSYEAERKSGCEEVSAFDDKFVGVLQVEDPEASCETLEKLIFPSIAVDREVVLSSTLGSGEWFLPVLDLEEGLDVSQFMAQVDRMTNERLRIFLRDLNPMVFRTGNSLHLYGRELRGGGGMSCQREFEKFCGSAILSAQPVLDTRWVAHSLVRGEFHFRISHLTGIKEMRPCRDPMAEGLLKLSLGRWEAHDGAWDSKAHNKSRRLS